MKRVARFLRRKKVKAAVDSSGFRTHNSSTGYDLRIRRKSKKKECLKLHLCLDTELRIILEFTVTSWNRNDSKEFDKLIEPIGELGLVAGDKAYSSRENCELVVSKQGKPYLYFKTNARSLAKGSPGWNTSFREFKEEQEEWLEVYHLRSLIESVFASIKRRFGSFLQSKKRGMQEKELGLKVLAHQVKQALLHRAALKQKVPFWVEVK
jgi:transposase